MEIFEIRVKEILSRIVEIEAENEEHALDLVKKKYYGENIVLDYSDFENVDFKSLIDEQGDKHKK